MSIRALIVDDESLARRGIEARLRGATDVEVVGTCENGRAAVAAIREAQPDLVFLDVQMPGLDGFDVIEAIGADQMPAVIFVTAYDAYALRAFQVHAFDYLLKPIDDERFERALDRVRARQRQRQESTLARRLAALLDTMKPAADAEPSPSTDERFIVKAGGRIVFVKADEIDWVEAAGDYVQLHVGDTAHLLRETMINMERRLDDRFLRVHRSTIVNVERIQELRPHLNGEYHVLLHGGTRLKTSRRYRDRLQAFFGDAL